MQTLNLKILLTVVIACITAGHSFSAPVVKSKGYGSVVYKALFGPKKENKDAALSLAIDNAKFVFEESLSGDRDVLYRRAKKQNLFRGVNLVTGNIIIFEETDKKAKRYTVGVEATINMNAIERAFLKLGPAAPDRAKPAPAPVAAPAPAPAEKTYMAFLFVAKELATKETFKDRERDFRLLESEKSGKEENKLDKDGLSLENNLSKSEAEESISGGSTLQKASERKWRTFPTIAVDNAVSKVLTRARYTPVPAVFAGLDVKTFKKEFGEGNEPSPETQLAAVATCREKGIKYLAVANMEVGLPRKDPMTGQQKVVISVTGSVLDIGGLLPEKIASWDGVPYYGLGPDDEVARRNALNKAGEMSAKDLVDQLRVGKVKS